jgi:hypothetical protein
MEDTAPEQVIVKPKKITASSVCKEFNLTPVELHELLTEIYGELESINKSEEPIVI